MFCPYKYYFYMNSSPRQYPGDTPQDPPPLKVTPKDMSYNTSYINASLRIPVLSGGPNPQVINNINGNIQNDIMEFKNQIEAGAKNDLQKQQQQGKPIHPYTASNVYETTFNKNGILSLTLLYHTLLTGLHNYVKTSYNYDISTGRALSLQDLFKPGTNYVQVLNNEIRRELASDSKKYLTTAAKFTGITNDQPFYLQDNSLVVFFGFNEVAPVAAEIPVIRIPFSRISGILKPSILR